MAAIVRLTITADIKGYCPIGHLRTSLISDVGLIGHPCYGQLTPVKRRYPLTSIT